MPYKTVPITAAKEIAAKYNKQEIVIISVDREFNKVHITTYGADKHYCDNAAVTGDFLKEVLQLEKPSLYHRMIEECKERWQAHKDKSASPEKAKCPRCGKMKTAGKFEICCM